MIAGFPISIKSLVKVTGCSVINLALLSACHREEQRRPPVAKAGVLDLRDWNFAKDGQVPLKGEWLFAWQDFDTGISTTPSNPPSIMNVPSQWQGQKNPKQPGQILDGLGYGSYGLRVLLPPKNDQNRLAILVPEVYSAQRITARQDGQILLDVTQGILGTNAVDEVSQNRPIVEGLLHPSLNEFQLTWQISNFHHSRGGGRRAPILGAEHELRDSLLYERLQATALIGILMIMAFYHFGLVIQRPEDKASLWFGITLFSLAIRQITTSQIIETLFPIPNAALHEFLSSLRYLTLYLSMPCFMAFVYHLVPGKRFHRFNQGFWAISALFILSTICLPLLHFSPYSLYFPFVQGCACVASLIHLGQQAWRGHRDARLSLIGTTIYVGAMVHDILIGWGFFINIYLTSYASVVFVFSQSYLLAERFAKTYRENEHYAQELAEKEKARTLFFHNTSHELRTPLNGMIGFMQFLAAGRYGVIPEAAEIQVQKCIRLALSLKNQVNTILDLAKSKKGTLALSNSLVDLNQLASEADDLAAGLLLKNQSLSFEMHRNWPESEATIIADREKLSAILRNLLGNAFKFSDSKRPNHVTLMFRKVNGGLEITVTDTGIGIASDQQSKVFEEFQQLAGDARRGYEGTGLGLAMVRDVVALMSGTIQLQSTLGAGSSFQIWIPAQKEVHVNQEPALLSPSSTLSLPILPPELPRQTQVKAVDHLDVPKASEQAHILVVDDNEVNCEVLQELLLQGGYRVTLALGGEEALIRARSDHPDLILLDMMMPNVSGEDVIRIAQQDPDIQDIPIILITARASDDDRVFGLSLGADDYLAKPIHFEELLFRVKNLLYRRHLSGQVIALEERERLAQLGEMIQDLSHELKNIFAADSLEEGINQQASQTILQFLPFHCPSYPFFVDALIKEKFIDSAKLSLDSLAFSDAELKKNRSLRSLRASIAQLDLSQEQRQDLWQTLNRMSPEQWRQCDETVLIIRSYLSMRGQTRLAIDLIMNILDYSRRTSLEDSSNPDLVIQRVMKLVMPRLYQQKIRMETLGSTPKVKMQPIHLMQILLNLLSNACDALEVLPHDQRWIRLTGETIDGRWHLRIRNGGPPLNADLKDQLFKRSVSSKAHRGFGLGLGISRRLAQRSQGSLDLVSDAPQPEFLLTLQLDLQPSLA